MVAFFCLYLVCFIVDGKLFCPLKEREQTHHISAGLGTAPNALRRSLCSMRTLQRALVLLFISCEVPIQLRIEQYVLRSMRIANAKVVKNLRLTATLYKKVLNFM